VVAQATVRSQVGQLRSRSELYII